MSDIDVAEYPGRFEYVMMDNNIPRDHFVRFVVMFIKSFIKLIGFENQVYTSNNPGRPSYSFMKMSCLVYYAFAEGITDSKKIEYNAKWNKLYIYAGNGIEPSYKTIENFIKKWGTLFDLLVAYTINFARIAGFTGMEHVSFDGTVKKAPNNKFNVVKREDVEVLMRYFKGMYVTRQELLKLCRPAKNILNRLDLSNRQKIELLENIEKRFKQTGKNTIPVNDIDAIHLVDKNNNSIIGYNIQTAVDNMSKMFCAILLSQKATDHDQFPDIFNKALDNIGKPPEKCSADSAYGTYETLMFINENDIDAYIDNTRQAKIRNGHKSKKIFHKDNMTIDYENNCIKCYANQPLYYQDTKIKVDSKTGKTKVRAEYYNKEACTGCVFKLCCCKKKKFRKVIVSGGEVALKMEEKMIDYSSIYEYLKRFFTVEPPNGSLKVYYHINEMLTRGKTNIQTKLNLCAGSYNLKRLYNIILKNYGSLSKFEDKNKQIHNKCRASMYINTYNKLKRNNILLLPE